MSANFATPWTVASQALLSMGFSRQEYWSGLSFPSPGDLHNPGIEPVSLALSGRFSTTEPAGKSPYTHTHTHTHTHTEKFISSEPPGNTHTHTHTHIYIYIYTHIYIP